MEQYDYDTEQSVRVASGILSDGGGKASEEDKSTETDAQQGLGAAPRRRDENASSTTGASTPLSLDPSTSSTTYPQLTINTRRRLIRKPLPDVPSSGARTAARSISAAAAKTSAKGDDGQHTSDANVVTNEQYKGFTQSLLFARNDNDASATKRQAMTLEQARKRTHEVAEKERAMLEWWPEMENKRSASTEPVTRLNARCQQHLLHIVRSTVRESFPGHASERIAEAVLAALLQCVESITQPKSLSALQRTASVLWRVDALVRSDDQLHGGKGGIAALLGILGVRWSRLVSWRGKDTNLGSLDSLHDSRPSLQDKRTTSASSSTTFGTEQRRKKRDVALQLLTNAIWMAGAGSVGEFRMTDGATMEEKSSDMATGAPDTAAKKRSNGTPASNLALKPALPTVALSSTLEQKDDDQVKEKLEERPSMLADRLSMQLRSASRSNSDYSTASLRETSRRSSPRTSLEKRAFVYTMCKVCVQFVQDEQPSKSVKDLLRDHRGRSDTLSTLKGNLRRLENLSTMSSKSDNTVRLNDAKEHNLDERDIVVVEWKADEFEGDSLNRNPLSTDVDRFTEETAEGVEMVGGTFIVYCAENEEIQAVIAKALDVGLYASLSMMLEASLLADFDVSPEDPTGTTQSSDEEVKGEDADAEETSHFENVEGLNKETNGPHESDHKEIQGGYGHWPRHIWGMFQQHGQSRPNKRASASSMMPARSKTTEADTRGSSEIFSPGAPQYGRFGKLISSLTGHVHKPKDSDQQEANRPRSLIEGPDSSSSEDDRFVQAGQSATDTAMERAKANDKEPLTISPNRDLPGDLDVRADGNVDFVDRIMAKQSLSLVVLEGLDVSLPFAQVENNWDHHDVKKSNENVNRTAASASRQTGEGQGSTLSAQSGTPSTSSHSRILANSEKHSATTLSSPDVTEKHRREVLFYRKEGRCRDTSLGQAIEEMAAKATLLYNNMILEKSKKEKSKGDSPASYTHRIAQYIHGRDKISVCATICSSTVQKRLSSQVSTPAAVDAEDYLSAAKEKNVVQLKPCASSTNDGANQQIGSHIQLWHADMRTGRQSAARTMCDATYLTSFGVFLDSLMEIDPFTKTSPLLFGDSEDDTDALSSSDDPKHDLIRLFKVGDVLLKFHIQRLSIFNLFIEGPVVEKESQKQGDGQLDDQSARIEAERSTLTRTHISEIRREIQAFYGSVKSEVSRLEHVFVARELDSFGKTIRPNAPESSRGSVRSIFSEESDQGSVNDSLADSMQTGYSGAASEPLELLQKVTSSLRRKEFELYDLLKDANSSSLNDVRRVFIDRAASAENRLRAWSRKHLTKSELDQVGPLRFVEPIYQQKGTYALPGSQYVLRQDEPLSIIAYSLSSRDFKNELVLNKRQKLADVLHWRSSVAIGDPEAPPSTIVSQKTSSLAPSMVSSIADAEALDPDLDENFHIPEPLHVNMKRKKRTKDVGILSLRIRSSVYGSKEKGEGDEGDASMAVSEPDVIESVADRTLDHLPNVIASEDSLSTPTASRIIPSSQPPKSEATARFDTVSSANEVFRAHVSTISPDNAFAHDDGPPHLTGRGKEGEAAASLFSSSVSSTSDGETVHERSTNVPASDLAVNSEAVRKQSESRDPGPRYPSPSFPVSPHIKHTVTTGHLKISCLSWFAEDFAKLRKAWNVEEDFVASLSRSKTWSNVGGKSKSGFYLTGDGRWIAKQLLNVWTVDEKEAFLEFAPAYLRYMMNSVTNDCPTLLVKIAGVYSLKIKDVKTGEVKLKLSVQVLENVFAGDDGQSIRFDLKGIRDRRAAANKAGSAQGGEKIIDAGPPTSTATAAAATSTTTEKGDLSVWWDSEWIEAVQPRAFVPEREKMLFKRALQNDLAFLTASNVMDYSLLVGVHESTKGEARDQDTGGGGGGLASSKSFFRVRIVDFLGAWTLVKQLESSGKKAIKSQAPTVLPPHEYASRFHQAVESYFIACPSVGDDKTA